MRQALRSGEPGDRVRYYPGRARHSHGSPRAVNFSTDVQIAGTRVPTPRSLEPASARTGSLQGVKVEVSDDTALLTNAAEEISTFMSISVERRDHGERRVRAENRLRGMTPEEVNVYFEQAKLAKDPQELVQRARHLLRQEGAHAGEAILEDGRISDPTEHYLLLQLARSTALAEGAPARTRDRLDSALADLEARHGGTIRASLASIDHAAKHGQTAQEISHFQKATLTVLDQPTLHMALRQVLDLAGRQGARFESAMDNLRGALGACMAAAETERERILLQTLVNDLYQLKSLKTLLEACKDLLRSFRYWRPRDKQAREQDDVPNE